jgi:hypothetical protein
MLTFDAANKRIILDSATISATELYSRSADWLALSDNAKYGAVFRQVGGDDLGGGLSIPPYYFLQGLWRVRPMESSHNLTVTGNLFVDGGGVPVVNTLGTFQVNVNYTVPVLAQGISTGGTIAPTVADIWSHPLEGTFTAEQVIRIMSAVLAGKATGAETNEVSFRDVNDTKSRVRATVDANSNRTAVIYDVV